MSTGAPFREPPSYFGDSPLEEFKGLRAVPTNTGAGKGSIAPIPSIEIQIDILPHLAWMSARHIYWNRESEQYDVHNPWVPLAIIGPMIVLGHSDPDNADPVPIVDWAWTGLRIPHSVYEKLLEQMKAEMEDTPNPYIEDRTTGSSLPDFSILPIERPKVITRLLIEQLHSTLSQDTKEHRVFKDFLDSRPEEPDEDFMKALALRGDWQIVAESILTGIPVLPLNLVPIDPSFMTSFRLKQCQDLQIAPLWLVNGTFGCATYQTSRFKRGQIQTHIRDNIDGAQVTLFLAPPADVRNFQQRCFGGIKELGNAAALAASQNADNIRGVVQLEIKEAELASASFDPKAPNADERKLLHWCLLQCATMKGSDLHIQIEDSHGVVRVRVDGRLHTIHTSSPAKMNAVVNQAIFQSGMNSNVRAAGDAKMRIRIGEATYDLRLSKLPVKDGEQPALVARFLPGNSRPKKLSELDLPPHLLTAWDWIAKREYGLVLVSGPTGSGKTTTLAAALTAVNDEATKIVTIEDPVEYKLTGVVQVATTRELTFAQALRAFLRHDPDVILVGELRDNETAAVAVEAAKTGHLVFSTIHANHALLIPSRLGSMGLPTHEVGNALEAIQAQRLLPKLCPHCSRTIRLTDLQKRLFDKFKVRVPDGKIAIRNPDGCGSCGTGKGLSGRAIVMEVLTITDSLREAISHSTTVGALQSVAAKSGFIPMFAHGLMRVAAREVDWDAIQPLPQYDLA